MGDGDQVHALLSCAVAVVLTWVDVSSAAGGGSGRWVVHFERVLSWWSGLQPKVVAVEGMLLL